jgi:hypothetical protein
VSSDEDGDDGGAEIVCIDKDDDGFYPNCLPADCDDRDPDTTDECVRCKNTNNPGDGCPCERGTAPIFCEPKAMQVEGGVKVCKEGSRFCRQERWSECEAIGEYVFVPDP